jgi:hypothetical protein
MKTTMTMIEEKPTISITMLERLEAMSMKQLRYTKEYVDELIEKSAKCSMYVGTKVNIVQKTKKTPGVVTKVMKTKCLVKCRFTTYRVPMSMLEAA